MMALVPLMNRPQRLAELLAGLETSAVPEVEVSGVTLDSRHVSPGDLFLACPGLHQHGLAYAEQAAAAGAVAVAWDADFEPAKLPVPSIRVTDLAVNVGAIAARFWEHPSRQLFVTGITGTDGKTSCTHLLAQALDYIGQRCGYMGTLGYGFIDDWHDASHTTPDAVTLQGWLARLRDNGAAAVALEASSHALAQHRADSVNFDIAVLTNIGRDHLDYHGDIASYTAAKRRLFDMSGLRCAVLNIDDQYGRQWLDTLPNGVRPVAFGMGPSAAQLASEYVAVREVKAQPQGLSLTFDTHVGELHINTDLVGHFNAANLAAVLAVLLARGIGKAKAGQALQQVKTVPGRMQQISINDDQPLVVVDYAHTPNALEQALRAVCAHVPGRVHCVFGCGGDRDRGKRSLMGAVAAHYADSLWITDDNPRSESPEAIVAEIVAGIGPDNTYLVEHDRVIAITQAIQAAQSGDVVLIAGKGHETTQEIGDQIRSHDDRVVAQRVLEAA